MIKKSLVELVKCRLREFIREPSAAFFVFTMPVLWMVLLGFTISSGKKQTYSVGVIKTELRDSSSEQKTLELTLESREDIKLFKEDKEDLFKRLRQNEINLIIDLSDPKKIHYSYDDTNPRALLHKLEINRTLQTALGRQDTISSKETIYTPSGSRYVDFLIPGLVAFSLLSTSLFGVGMIIVVSRREKLLQRFLVTPMKPLDYFTSHLVSRMIVAFLEVLVILLAGALIFGFTVKGSLLSFSLLSFLGALCFTSLAILCASRGRNSSAYSGFVNLIVIVGMFLSGVWFNRNIFPVWLQDLSRFSPLSALVDGLRKIALEGESLMALGSESLILSVYLFFFLIMSKKYFRWM